MANKAVKWAKFEEGGLKRWKKTYSAAKRREILEKAVKKDGYTTIVRRLIQLRNVTKDEDTVKKANADWQYLKKKYR